MKNFFLLSLMLVIPLSIARAQPFPPPQNLYGLSICDSIYVSWDPPDSGEVMGYNIYRLEEKGADWYFYAWVPSVTDSFIDQGGVPFCYGVTALYDGGESNRAELCEFDIADVFSFPPDRVEAEAMGDSIWLSWSEGQFGCGVPVGYEIFRRPEEGIHTLIASVPPVPRNYLDLNLDEGTWCYYINIVSTGGQASSAEVCATVSSAGITGESPNGLIPLRYNLRQNYPNPFNPSTTISFDIPDVAGTSIPGAEGERQRVTLAIYDLRGRRVRTLIDSNLEPGSHMVVWNGKNDEGSELSSGIYLYSLRFGEQSYIRKMIVRK